MIDMAYRKRSLDLSMSDDSASLQRTDAALPPIRSIPEFNAAVASSPVNHMERGYVHSGQSTPHVVSTQQRQQQQQLTIRPASSPGQQQQQQQQQQHHHVQHQPLPPPPPPSAGSRYHTQQQHYQPLASFRDPTEFAPTMRASPISSSHSGNSPYARPTSTIHINSTMEDGTASASDTIKVARNWSREETLSLVRAIGRHYESLKRCKTNQERSNVWHTIHKEHSSQFPGRSKKASQDRWGKVLSDYKDVVVHNKEKGAARWTFDFFKEVANIVDSDSQFAEVAGVPTHSAPSAMGLGLSITTSHHSMRPVYDDSSSRSAGTIHSRGTSQHRLSDPSMQGAHSARSPPRGVFQHQHQKSMSYSPAVVSTGVAPPGQHNLPQAPPMMRHNSQTIPGRHGSSSFSYYPNQQPGHHHPYMRQSPPSRRTQYSGQHTSATAQSPPESVSPMHRNNSASAGQAGTSSAQPGTAVSPMVVAQTPVVAGGISMNSPEQTCRYVLDILDQQMKRIDAQQESLVQLRESTQAAMNRVENILQTYNQN